MTAPAIELVGLEKSYAGTPAVDGIDLAVPPGSFLVLLGPSGCGKTTTLRMLAGLEAPTGGEIRFGERLVASGSRGVAIAPGKRDAGLVFQSYALWPHMTVRANVEWPLKVARWPAARRRERVAEVLQLLGIAELEQRYPGEISGGQQQRVAIARMIAPSPGVLLFDEPLSNLDAKLRVETRGELLRVHRATGATSVYVTHDQVEAMTMATHVALMRDGRIEQFGTPAELLARPQSAFVATFIGTPPANVLDAQVRGGRFMRDDNNLGEAADLDAGPLAEGGAVQLMYRAESLALVPEGGQGCLAVEFADSTPLAGRHVVAGWASGTRISVVTEQPPEAIVGERLWIRVPDRPDAVFGGDGRRLAEGCPPSEALEAAAGSAAVAR
ncbi:MAG TPA: ABC transporter ATP-binding protein [Actinomycetales bacterium]|jgi:iron(III) transport system ATP-binding protein|nr:ABC transporter ATP-binding protein [Actinomycetales bacterium]